MLKQLASFSMAATVVITVVALTSPASIAVEQTAGGATNPGNDSLNPVPFLMGPNPDECVSCTWPEGSPTYHGDNS